MTLTKTYYLSVFFIIIINLITSLTIFIVNNSNSTLTVTLKQRSEGMSLFFAILALIFFIISILVFLSNKYTKYKRLFFIIIFILSQISLGFYGKFDADSESNQDLKEFYTWVSYTFLMVYTISILCMVYFMKSLTKTQNKVMQNIQRPQTPERLVNEPIDI